MVIFLCGMNIKLLLKYQTIIGNGFYFVNIECIEKVRNFEQWVNLLVGCEWVLTGSVAAVRSGFKDGSYYRPESNAFVLALQRPF
ncbi:hypothetical protein FIM25_02785 [Desulfobotulus mexicanus]|uniref:Uncharacterized protein n=1 Tax=Desulfobotulus mexicanus TaxID=2586642 RepID=A0A5Q4VDS1_9BACT|nr:hypothetical protein FIM25_02785 [Desulfobotulus mexicanus]